MSRLQGSFDPADSHGDLRGSAPPDADLRPLLRCLGSLDGIESLQVEDVRHFCHLLSDFEN